MKFILVRSSLVISPVRLHSPVLNKSKEEFAVLEPVFCLPRDLKKF